MIRVLLLLIALAATACATTGATPQPFPGAVPPPAASSGTPVLAPAAPADTTPGTGPRTGYAVAGTALGLRGIPYRLGGTDPNGFDCSGLVRYVFEQHGLAVPRSVAEQFNQGREVQPHSLEPGDLVFFSTKSAGASHVGIALGGDEFVHAPASNGVVRVERIGGSYWTPRFVGARRIIRQP